MIRGIWEAIETATNGLLNAIDEMKNVVEEAIVRPASTSRLLLGTQLIVTCILTCGGIVLILQTRQSVFRTWIAVLVVLAGGLALGKRLISLWSHVRE